MSDSKISKKSSTRGTSGRFQPTRAFRLIRWLGQKPQYVEVRVKGRSSYRDIDYEFEETREAPTPGASTRFLRPASIPGLSRIYQWGPKFPFTAEVLEEDAELILQHPTVGNRFRDVTGVSRFGKYTVEEAYANGGIQRLDDPFHGPSIELLTSRGRR